MANLGKFTKQPREVFDYDIVYGQAELPSGDTILTAEAEIVCINDAADNTLTPGAVTWADRRSKVWLADGTHLKDYKITVLARSVGGRVLEDEFTLRVKET